MKPDAIMPLQENLQGHSVLSHLPRLTALNDTYRRRKTLKYLRPLCAAAVLTVVLSISAFAGETGCPVARSTMTVASTSTPTREILCGISPVTEIALNLLHSVLLLF